MEYRTISVLRQSLALLGMVMVLAIVFADTIYEFNLRCYRKWGWTRLANRFAEEKKFWLPFSLVVMAAVAVLCYLALALL